MAVGAGPGIGDAGDLAQGPEQGGTESESGGELGSAGISNKDFNEAAKKAFKEAINRALGYDKGVQEKDLNALDQIAQENLEEKEFNEEETGTIDPGFNFQDRGYEPNMEVDVGIGQMDESQFDNPLDTAPVFGSDDGKDFADPDFNLGTEANTPIGKQGQSTTNLQDSPVSPSFGTREEQEREIDRDYFEGKTKTGQALNEALNQDFDDEGLGFDEKGKPFNRNQQEHLDHARDFTRSVEAMQDRINKMDIMSTERGKLQRQLNAIKDTDLFSKAYDFANPSALSGMLANIMGTLGMKSVYGIAKSIESKARKAGFFDRSTFADLMGQLQDPEAFGAMGNPLGTGGADQNKEVMKKIINNVEPWTKGLTLTQVQYYFDRPQELEWVRNLWSSMNPTTAV